MYQFQFEYDFQDLLILNRVHIKTRAGRKVAAILLRFVLLLMGVPMVVTSAWALSLGQCELSLIVFLLMGLLYIVFAIFYYQFCAWYSKRLQMKGTGELTVTVDEDSVREHSLKGDNTFPWNAFASGYHSRERYFLFIDPRHAVILPERALTQGDSAALKSFLEEKLHKEVKEIP